uniref:hypothetical protein n=1 Tax=Acetatifactor sp. TaxID=1872090 RepID=UPI00405730AD
MIYADKNEGTMNIAIDNRKKWICRFVALAVVGGLFICFHEKAPFIYATNDDLFLKSIASGEVTGTPEARLLHIGYPVGVFLKMLYSILPELPWYGLFLCVSFGVTMYVVLCHMLKCAKNIITALVLVLVFVSGAYAFLFMHVAEIQYTTVTAMTGAGAIFMFAITPVEEAFGTYLKKSSVFLLLAMWAYSIRSKAFLMLLPFVVFVFIGKYMDSDTDKTVWRMNEKRKNLCYVMGILIVCLFCVWSVNSVAYSSKQWKDFVAYNSARESIYDYAGYPDYEVYYDVYQKLEISESSYHAASTRYGILLDENIDVESMQTLAGIVKDETALSLNHFMPKLKNMIYSFYQRHISYTDRPLNLLVYTLYTFFLIMAVLAKKKAAIRDIGFVFVARMMIWSYLVYISRMPSRVTQGIYLAELVSLLAIAWNRKLWEKKILWYISSIGLVFLMFRFGIPKAEAVAYEVSSRLNFSKSFEEIKVYFAEHPDNLYYLDMNSFSSFTEEIFKTGQSECDNYMLMGSWLPKSPWYDEKLERAGIKDVGESVLNNENVYVVFMNTDATDSKYLIDFYAENYPGAVLEKIEEIEGSNNIVFEIWKGNLDSIVKTG